MGSQRQQNWLGQQRVDIPHLRALEAGVAGDFDVLAGNMLTGQVPVVIEGFNILRTNAVANDATALVLEVAGSELIHFSAAESGSIFRVPDDRPNETLSVTNAKVIGGFTSNATNYIGIELVRQADDATTDTVQFLDTSSNSETAKTVPLARTLDYRIVVTTTNFSALPGVAPVAKVVTDVSNKVVSIEDARILFFRLGGGGTTPQAINPFPWPAGRDEDVATLGGDRSIFSLKEWIDATMTRLWELGGGEFWYSPTADRNVRMVTDGAVFAESAEHFYWDGTDLRWKGVKFVFNNSTGEFNEVEDHISPSAGLTDLADGECIYVDIDRTQNLSGGDALTPVKTTISGLGESTPRPGQRWVVAWRSGSSVFVRDRPFAVGSAFTVATAMAHGTVRLTANSFDLNNSYAVTVGDLSAGVATAGGISHNADEHSTHNIPSSGDIVIGRGAAAGDENIRILTQGSDKNTQIDGSNRFSVSDIGALRVTQSGVAGSAEHTDRVVELRGYLTSELATSRTHFWESGGAWGARNVSKTPAGPPAAASDDIARTKFFVRPNKNFTAIDHITTTGLPAYTAAGSGVGKTLTADANGALTLDGLVLTASETGNLALVKNESTADSIHHGIYTVTDPGDASNPWILTRATDFDTSADFEENTAAGPVALGSSAGSHWKLNTYPIDLETTEMAWIETTDDIKDQFCVMGHDSIVDIISESSAYT